MTLWKLILREMQRSKLNTLLCLLCVFVATSVLVGMVAVSRASVDATRKMMKEMGFNLLITPGDIDPAQYQALQFEGGDMPWEYVDKLAGSTALAQHLVGKYQKTIQVNEVAVVLTGVKGELTKHGTVKKPMPTAYTVPEGEIYVGFAAANALKIKPGDTLAVLGRNFTVGMVLEEKGTIPEDIRLFAHLSDVQTLLGKEGRINAIDALACYCPVSAKDIIAALTNTVQAVLPDVNVKPYHSILIARQKQRKLIYKYELFALAIVVTLAAAAIWGLTWQNVRHRAPEIGVYRALGIRDSKIATLFLGKILVYSLGGAILGCIAGWLGANMVNLEGGRAVIPPMMWLGVPLGTAIAAMLFGLPPIFNGLLQEPVDVLTPK